MTISQKILANAVRALAMDAVEAANSGHPGLPMGFADVATVLFSRYLKFDAARPSWPDRDRLILSAGHGSMLLYALSYLTGYAAMPLDELKKFRQLGSRTPGHPERDIEAGIEMTTGPLGQGIATAVGFALAERILNARYGDDLVDHKTYVIASDGDMMEGISHEAAALAGHLALNRLIVLYDDNGISIDGPTALSFTEDVPARFTAYGWATRKIDGHDSDAIDAALAWAQTQDKPVLIACKTTIGFGAPSKAGTAACHGSPLGADEIAAARKNLNWPHAPFVVPDDILKEWRALGRRNANAYTAWEKRLAQAPDDVRQRFIEDQAGVIPKAFDTAIADIKKNVAATTPSVATRKASLSVLEKIIPTLPNLIGGSADLTGSNLTQIKGPPVIGPGTYTGQYIHYGVREHGMAAAMNGLTLHGGLRAYGGTFLTFSDYCCPAIRLAALMHCPSIFVMTHDSIGLGEDGPTHQPVEHLAALRAIPDTLVLRPADATETAEAWQIALHHKTGPVILCLTRQNLPTLRADGPENLSMKGGYTLIDSPTPRVVLCATGSEVEIAAAAHALLAKQNIPARVVSIPSFELFRAQPQSYRDAVLGPAGTLRVGIEAAIRQGWDEIIDSDGIFIGMPGFGASAPAPDLYAHFNITAESILEQVQRHLRTP